MSSIFQRVGSEWRALSPSDFASEEALHDLVEETPNSLPLSGDPRLTVFGREVGIGPGYADLIAVDERGQLAVIEIKLRRNAEARRAVVAQVLTYAAYLRGCSVEDLETILRPHLDRRGFASVTAGVQSSDQSGGFDGQAFADGLQECLSSGAFRLVLVLDEAPAELVQLVGYLESITAGVTIDLITVASFGVGSEQIMVPQRVDPERQPDAVPVPRASARTVTQRHEVVGSDQFERSIDAAAPEHHEQLRRLLSWARSLEAEQLANLRTVVGNDRTTLIVGVPGEKAGLVSVSNFTGAFLYFWRTAFVRRAWRHIAPVEEAAGLAVGQGNTLANPSDAVLDALTEAYGAASEPQPVWNERDFYVAFGEGERRIWDEARKYNFVCAGGDEWYSRTLRVLRPGNRVYVYIPKGMGVGGYVGVGEVTGEAIQIADFEVTTDDGQVAPFLSVTQAPEAGEGQDDPARSEYIVPVRWIDTRSRDEAIKDSDFFANQNSATKLTHGYTTQALDRAFGISESG